LIQSPLFKGFSSLTASVNVLIAAAWLAALLVFELVSVVNDSGTRVEFASGPAFLDFDLYAGFQFESLRGLLRPFEFLHLALNEGLSAGLGWLSAQVIVPGPVYPALVSLFGFQASPALFSVLYVALGLLLGLAWAAWAKGRDMPWQAQVLLGAFPFLVYYAVLVSTDLLFALWVWAAFYLLSKAGTGGRIPFVLITAVILMAVLTRPTGLAIVGIAGLFLLLHSPRQMFKTWPGVLLLLFLFFLSFWGLIYYAPYYLVHDANGANTHYFGLLPQGYKDGLFPSLPEMLDTGVSWMLLLFAKLFHAVGLRPSYSDVHPLLTLARALPGLIFLPGLLLVMIKGSLLERIFVGLFMLPVFVAASQERYLLGIMPILFYWGWVFWAGAFRRLGASAQRLVIR
jgi:hypothetical protein